MIHAAQTAIWTTNAAATIQMSGIRLAARSVLFAVLIFFLLVFVPVPVLVLVIRPQKLDVTLQVKMSADIRSRLGLSTVVVHPKESAACATAAGTAWVPGPYTAKPLITTGAGDHFNAGFSNAQLLGLSPESCLTVGVCTSGHYVRTGQSPTLADLTTFLQTWN